MPLSLSNLKPAHGSRTRSRRVGRGNAGRGGTTAGRGTKGQKARTGGRGGLKRLGMRRLLLNLPKVGGFRSIHKKPAILNVGDLERVFAAGAEVTPSILLAKGLVNSRDGGIKILGDGEITKKLHFQNVLLSKSASEKIKKAGGSIIK